METNLAPPAYDSHETEHVGQNIQDTAPPRYTPPTQFKIGSKTTPEPLVSIQQIKGHFALLHAFSDLRNRVDETEIFIPNVPKDKDRKWAWFVGLAVERFDRWCMTLTPEDASRDGIVMIPPIDVLMVWHSYMLNPGWYIEDSMRLPACKILRSLEEFFQQVLEDPVSRSLLFSDPPTTERAQLWKSRTTLPFDPFDCMSSLSETSITCPQCGNDIRVALMTAEGTGYLQQDFSTVCKKPGCTSGVITKDTLAFRKLVQDLCTYPSKDHSSYLPGFLFPPPFSAVEAEKSRNIKLSFCESARSKGAEEFALNSYAFGSTEYNKRMVLAMMKYCQNPMFARQRMSIQGGPHITPRIMSAYSDDKIYSIELVGAVLRQGSFVQKMFDFGWTHPGYFDDLDNELVLHHALTRYHAFLYLMNSSSRWFYVPTLDIDLVWHTHQLMTTKYVADCDFYVGRFINHDDKIEGLRLSSAFDMTCMLWKEHFNLPYTYCGCPLPPDPLINRNTHAKAIDTYASSLAPISDRTDFLAATHASDHNAVRYNLSDRREQPRAAQRYEELARAKAARMKKKTAESSAGFSIRPLKGGTTASSDAYAHQVAFLVPIPFYNKLVYTGPADCVGGGSVVSSPGGCSSNISGTCGAGGCTGSSGARCSSGGEGIGGGCA